MSFFPRALAAPAAPLKQAIEWEEPDCLLCGSQHRSWLVEAPDRAPGGSGLWFAVVQCQDCGLCFTNPRPSPRSMAQFYLEEDYEPYRLPRRKHTRRSWLAGWRWPREGLSRQVLSWHGTGRLLDFGCGGGTFLHRMSQWGWQVTGLDISAATVCRVQTAPGLRVLAGSLPHPELEPASFDVITMRQSLEHVHDPGAVLREAQRLLAPGGKLMVAVPNIDSLAYRWFGPDWFGLDLPRHLTHFTPMTLHLMLERAGFRVGPVRMVRHAKWLSWSARQATRRRRRRPYWHHWLTARPAARLVTWYSSIVGQADCLLATAYKDKSGVVLD